MSEHIYKCPSCLRYTLKGQCPHCGKATSIPRPPKFSLDDKYAEYRRTAKKEILTEKGLY